MNTKPIIDENDSLRKLRGGDKVAFESIYTKYYGALYLHAYYKLRDREIAKDIVHDMFAGIWQRKETLEITTGLANYLYTGIRNRVIDYLAKEKSKAKYLESLSVFPERDAEATDHLLREKMLKEQIENAVDQLSPRLKEVFELSRIQHLSHKEISEKLNLSEQSVRSYIKDALRVLRLKLSSFIWLLVVYSKFF